MKDIRQQRIIELIKNNNIETQTDLLEELKRGGLDVTQATISRDIRELKINKVVSPDGSSRYAIPSTSDTTADEPKLEKFRRLFRDTVTSIDVAGNIIVIKTLSAMAMGVASALDHLHTSEIVGCIAGDDTVFAVVRDPQAAFRVANSMRNL